MYKRQNLARATRNLAKIFEENLRELEDSRLDQFKKKAVFVRWQADSEMNPDKWDLASALRCLPNSPSSVWHERLETLKADAQLHGDSEVLRFTDRMLALVNEQDKKNAYSEHGELTYPLFSPSESYGGKEKK